MISLTLISAEDIRCEWLQELRRYAAVPDDSQDALLRGLLKRAALVVQEYADTSVLACSLRLDVSGNGDDRIRLYQTVSEVTGVTDGSGVDIPHSVSGREVILGRMSEDVSVTYRTEPLEAERERLAATVIRYATALYDGQDNAELTKIIQEIC